MNATSPLPVPVAQIERYASREAAAEALAAAVAAALTHAIDQRGVASLAVPGGTTPTLFFRALRNYALDWPRVSLTLTDERCVPRVDPRSNGALVDRELRVGPAAAATWIPLWRDGAAADAAVAVVEQRLRSAPLPFDAVVLGVGLDGHVASLFPCHRSWEQAGARMAALTHAPDGTVRVSLTPHALGTATQLFLLAHGADKLLLLERALGSAGQSAALPVRQVLAARPAPARVLVSAAAPAATTR